MEMDYPKTRMDNFFAKAAGSELADDSMEPITDREYWINEMAKKTAGGGLPTIEEGDDGKVLTVSSGEAVWASGGGGGGSSVTIAECSYNSGTHTFTSPLTAAEMLEAYKTGTLIMHCNDENNDTWYAVIEALIDGDGYYVFMILQGFFITDAGSGYPTYTITG